MITLIRRINYTDDSKSGGNMKKLMIATMLLGIALSGAAMSKKTPVEPGAATLPQEDIKVTVLNAPDVPLADYKGKVVLLNFWATWCPYCVTEIPELIRLYEKYKEKGLVILSVDLKEAPGTVKEFAAKKGMTYTLFIDPTGEVAKTYNVSGIPTNVFFNKKGEKVYQDFTLPKDPEKFIEELLK